jgi:predicted dehydrogenase
VNSKGSAAPSRIGIIGCGNIAPVYLKTLSEIPWIDVASFADGLAGQAESFAARYGGTAVSVEDMLADDSLQAVVNLTPATAHAAVTRTALSAGRPVFSEKPLGIDFGEAKQLVDLARAKGVRLGCAPDTVLGVGLQTARAVIDKGMIGEPIGGAGFMLGFGPEWWHPNPEIFYTTGAGPLFDMGPYYLTAFASLLGPAKSIIGSARAASAERIIHTTGRVGDRFTAVAPTHVSSIIEFGSGAIVNLTTSFDVKATKLRNIEIFGSEATLRVPDPNTFGGPVEIKGILSDEWREVPLPKPNTPQQRGIGLADMLSATQASRPHRASAELALHVVELMTLTLHSAETGQRMDLTTSFDRPSPLDYQLPADTFDE